jgi:hypothetical protein
MTEDFLPAGEISTNARPSITTRTLFRLQSDFQSEYVTAELSVDEATNQGAADCFAVSEACVRILRKESEDHQQPEDKRMKRITLAAIATAFAALTVSAGASTTAPKVPAFSIQQSCAAAPAVARAYLADQVSAGHKLTMSRAAAIAEVTKQTGADGEFAGLKPCDSGYANAVRFYLDEVIKAGTNNSTP